MSEPAVSGDQSRADPAAHSCDSVGRVAEKCDAGFVTDGDADRIGAVDEQGNVVDAHKVFSVLLYWLLSARAGRAT